MIREALTFDDVLLVPQASTHSPSKVDTSVQLTDKIKLEIPILSAAMDTVTESEMAITLAQAGGLGVVHKNMSPTEQAAEVEKVKKENLLCGAAISIGQDVEERADLLVKAGVDALVVDVAHGHYYKIGDLIKQLKRKYGEQVAIIGGNVATGPATKDLIKAGADVIKVGVGPGSICTTRVIAGVGMPQLTAIMDAVEVARKTKTPIIADGGIKYSGDIVKALAGGASVVMLGGLLAGTDEAPGEVIEQDGQKYKTYRGMGSIDAMEAGSKDRYLQGDKKTKDMIAEGVVGQIKYKGSVKDIITQLTGGLRQGLGYCGAKNLTELAQKAEFIKMSGAGYKESHPHSLEKIKEAPNY
ncbi:MAG: IMP dehydrogenase [Parcubacteria group bacterium]|nr:IMP dehydrogenase [Parcubacteria group bacterium]